MELQGAALSRHIEGRTLFTDVDLILHQGDTLVVRGPSGVGKSQLLRGLAGLVPLDGTLSLDGRTMFEWGMPMWRAAVTYVPQRVPNLPDTPSQFLQRVLALGVQRERAGSDPQMLTRSWGLPDSIWKQPWARLSGGEGQRLQLAIAIARAPTVLLLDEPTAALDPTSVRAVEQSLEPLTVVWITHDAEQGERVATQLLELS